MIRIFISLLIVHMIIDQTKPFVIHSSCCLWSKKVCCKSWRLTYCERIEMFLEQTCLCMSPVIWIHEVYTTDICSSPPLSSGREMLKRLRTYISTVVEIDHMIEPIVSFIISFSRISVLFSIRHCIFWIFDITKSSIRFCRIPCSSFNFYYYEPTTASKNSSR